MARKNIFESVMREEAPAEDAIRPESVARKFGAAKSLSASIDELTKQASKLVEGEAVVELDASLLDGSFVADRLPDSDDQDYTDLLEAVRERGQDTPILVRPHPSETGRYMIVFGHRRARVAQELGRPVRAVVKQLADLEHVISQGQENSARANLSFIERTMFADRLEKIGYRRETIQAALSIDYQTLSKMLTIPKALPENLLLAIGAAKGVGRDRWLELRKLIAMPGNLDIALEAIGRSEFTKASSPERFEYLFGLLKKSGSAKRTRKALPARNATSWASEDQSVNIVIQQSGKTVTMALGAADGKHFADWITGNLDGLYASFRASNK